MLRIPVLRVSVRDCPRCLVPGPPLSARSHRSCCLAPAPLKRRTPPLVHGRSQVPRLASAVGARTRFDSLLHAFTRLTRIRPHSLSPTTGGFPMQQNSHNVPRDRVRGEWKHGEINMPYTATRRFAHHAPNGVRALALSLHSILPLPARRPPSFAGLLRAPSPLAPLGTWSQTRLPATHFASPLLRSPLHLIYGLCPLVTRPAHHSSRSPLCPLLARPAPRSAGLYLLPPGPDK